MKKYFCFLFAAMLLCFASSLCGCTGCGSGYSEGDRVGTITKFSHKGLIWKSWEGEMNLGGTTGGKGGAAIPTTWTFSVRDEKLISKVQKAMELNLEVKCHYTQWVISPIWIDSDYELVDISVVGE